MKCPRCGRVNGKTNKFCRECGLRLEGLLQQPAPQPQPAVTQELPVGEALVEVWELLKNDDLEAAQDKSEAMVRGNPDSASARSLVALIYERKAERELASGNTEGGHKFLKFAVAQYERIIDLNPDSTADREKLASLRRRLAGGVAAGQWAAPSDRGFAAALRTVPKPVWVAFGAFLIALVLIVILVPGRSREPARAESAGKAAVTDMRPSATPNAPSAPPASSLRVFSYPSTQSAQPTSGAAAPARSAGPPRPAPGRAPTIRDTHLTVAPPTRRQPGATTPRPPPLPETTPEPERPTGAASAGAKMLAQAIQLRNQKQDEDAIAAAQRAIALFQADIDAGRNVDAAKLGTRNAKTLIALCEESSGLSTGE